MIKDKTDIGRQPLGFHQTVSVGIYAKILFIIREMNEIGASLCCTTSFGTSCSCNLLDITALHLTSLNMTSHYITWQVFAWHDMKWHGMTWLHLTYLHSTPLHSLSLHMTKYDMNFLHLASFLFFLFQFNLIQSFHCLRHDFTWFHLTWHDMTWYDFSLIHLTLLRLKWQVSPRHEFLRPIPLINIARSLILPFGKMHSIASFVHPVWYINLPIHVMKSESPTWIDRLKSCDVLMMSSFSFYFKFDYQGWISDGPTFAQKNTNFYQFRSRFVSKS